MTNSLDYSLQEFQQILDKTSEILMQQYAHLGTQKGVNAPSQETLESYFDEPLPRTGLDSLQLLDEAKRTVFDTATGNLGPNMYAYVMGGGNQMSTIAEFLMSTINQNNTKWHLAPAMTEIEIEKVEAPVRERVRGAQDLAFIRAPTVAEKDRARAGSDERQTFGVRSRGRHGRGSHPSVILTTMQTCKSPRNVLC